MSERLVDIIALLDGARENLRGVERVLMRSGLLAPELEELKKAIEIVDRLAKRFRAFKGILR